MTKSSFQPDLDELVGLFYEDRNALGQLEEVSAGQLPSEYQRLLYHQEHMTVAMEALYESLVQVEVLETRLTETHYSRKILLRRQDNDHVVQFGIMRINLGCISDDVRDEIISQKRPLGRILVRHNLLRMIRLDRLWRITPGEDLCGLFGLASPVDTFGRTAGIDLDGVPAVEVLEIVAPL
jgi:hypothetical protein